jgi:hypothetical protein
MVGSWGLEPQTSTVSILRRKMHRPARRRIEVQRRIRPGRCEVPSVTHGTAPDRTCVLVHRNPALRYKVRHNFQRYLTSSQVIRRAEQSGQERAEEKSTRFSSSALLRATFSLTIRLLHEEGVHRATGEVIMVRYAYWPRATHSRREFTRLPNSSAFREHLFRGLTFRRG